MASFPAVFNGSVALYPLTEGVQIPVGVLEYTNFTQQRFVAGKAIQRFNLVLEQVSKTSRDSLQTFFDSVKGGFDKTWDITVGGVLYENMVFETDAFVDREGDTPESWSITLPCRQVKA